MDLNVFHVAPLTGIGGVQTYVASLVPYLSQLGITNRFLSRKLADEQYRDLNGLIINGLIDGIKTARNLIFPRKPTILHGHNNLGSSKLKAFLNVFRNVPLILHEQGNCWNTSSRPEIFRSNVAHSSRVICNSSATKAILSQVYGIENEKLIVIPNFIDYRGTPSYQVKSNYKSSPLKIGYIGRLEYFKGVHILLSSAKRILNDFPDLVEFHIVGDGSLKDRLQSDFASSNIIFWGRTNKPLDHINNFNLMIVPSIREPLGNVIIEAGLFSKPVVAANIDGIPDLIDNGLSGILLEPKKKPNKIYVNQERLFPKYVVHGSGSLIEPKEICELELSEVLLNFINDPGSFYNYGMNLNKKVTNYCSISSHLEKLLDLYRAVID